MAYKPEIEYVSKFYVYGSEAKELAREKQPRKAKTRLPLQKLEKLQNIYLDPVALFGIAVAVVMIVTMVTGAVHIQDTWDEYETMQRYVATLEQQNIELERDYRAGYNLADIEAAALALGMIPIEQAQTMQVTVTMPVVEEAPTAWESFLDYVQWFIDGLFA